MEARNTGPRTASHSRVHLPYVAETCQRPQLLGIAARIERALHGCDLDPVLLRRAITWDR
jgi:hypothetical protein